MPRGGPLRQILSTCSIAELKRIHSEFCSRVAEYNGDKSEFEGRLRDSLKRSIDDGEVSYVDIMETIRDELVENDGRQATTRIRDAVEGLTVTPNAGHKDGSGVREKWISSELYHALDAEFDGQPYSIVQEYSIGRSSADLMVVHDRDERKYLIEVKLAGSYSSRERALSQVRRYRKNVDGLRRSFVALIAESGRDLPKNKDSVEHILDEFGDEEATEVILKPPEDLLY